MLKIRRIRIDTYRENVVLLSRSCKEYRPEECQALKKIEITHDGDGLLAILMISDDRALVGTTKSDSPNRRSSASSLPCSCTGDPSQGYLKLDAA